MIRKYPIFNLRMSQELIDQVTNVAADLSLTRSELVRQAVVAHLERINTATKVGHND